MVVGTYLAPLGFNVPPSLCSFSWVTYGMGSSDRERSPRGRRAGKGKGKEKENGKVMNVEDDDANDNSDSDSDKDCDMKEMIHKFKKFRSDITNFRNMSRTRSRTSGTNSSHCVPTSMPSRAT